MTSIVIRKKEFLQTNKALDLKAEMDIEGGNNCTYGLIPKLEKVPLAISKF